jgi:hypothetical protein
VEHSQFYLLTTLHLTPWSPRELVIARDHQGDKYGHRGDQEDQGHGGDAKQESFFARLPLPDPKRRLGPGPMIARRRIVQIDPSGPRPVASSWATEIDHLASP